MQKSFTLIEILVTITILGFIAAVIAQNYVQLSKSARDVKIKASIESLRDALEIYRHDNVNNSYPPALQSLVAEDIIKTIPSTIVYTPLSCSATVCTTYTLVAILETSTTPYVIGPNEGK